MNSRAWQRGNRDCGNAFEVRRIGAALVFLLLLASLTAAAQGVQHLTITQPGGMPGLPILTGIEPRTNGLFITWDGPSGAYQLYQKSNSLAAKWFPLGRLDFDRSALVPNRYSNALFRISGPSPKYAGDATCRACHPNVCRFETNTPHANAFRDPLFKAYGGQTNSSCLPCHTVGFG